MQNKTEIVSLCSLHCSLTCAVTLFHLVFCSCLCAFFGRENERARNKKLSDRYNPLKDVIYCDYVHFGVSLPPVIPVNTVLLGVIIRTFQGALHDKL